MAGVDALKAKFFAAAGDLAPDAAQFPLESAGNDVTPLVDGDNYFGAINRDVQTLKTSPGTGSFFYFTNWHLGLLTAPASTVTAGSVPTSFPATFGPLAPFRLEDGSGTVPPLIDELEAMAVAGVDVRALAWLSPLVVSYEDMATKTGMYSVNAETLLSVDALRQRSHMDKKVCLNLLAHPLGAMHLKMVVCGDASGARAYVSGLDFQQARIDGPTHPGAPNSGWHDVGVRVAGPAVQGVYGWFRQLWNEQIGRDPEHVQIDGREVESYVDGTPSVPNSPPFPSGGGGSAHVQVLRTAPQMHFAFGSTDRAPVGCIKRVISGFRRDPWTSAPNGIFAFEAALRKAIANAERFIYVEDQGFWGQPIMDWLHDALLARPQLKLIMLHRSDPVDGLGSLHRAAVAINRHLLKDGVNFDDQVVFYERSDRVVIHSKLWIVDDEFAIVGSANAFRRSLYMDGETSLGVIDEDTSDTNFAVRLRSILWAEHCGLYTPADWGPFADVDAAIKIWNPAWGGSSAAPASLQPVFKRKHLPFVQGSADDQWPTGDAALTDAQNDQYDGDSRLEY